MNIVNAPRFDSGGLSSASGTRIPQYVTGGGLQTEPSFNSIQICYPSGILENDILIIHFGADGATCKVTPAFGFTELFFGASVASQQILWKRADGTENGCEIFSTTGAFSTVQCVRMTNWRYAIETGNPFVLASEASSTGLGTTPSLTTNYQNTAGSNNCLNIAFLNFKDNSAFTESNDDFWNNRYLRTTTTGNDFTLGAQDTFAPIDNGINPSSASYTNSLTSNWIMSSFLLMGVEVETPRVMERFSAYRDRYTYNYPPVIDENDILIMQVWSSTGTNSLASATGWTVIDGGNNSGVYSTTFLWKRATGAESGFGSFSYRDGFSDQVRNIWRIKGCATTGSPFDDTDLIITGSTPGTNNISLTVSGTNRMFLCLNSTGAVVTSDSETNVDELYADADGKERAYNVNPESNIVAPTFTGTVVINSSSTQKTWFMNLMFKP